MPEGGRAAAGAIFQLGGRVTKILAGVLAFGICSRALGLERFGTFTLVFAWVLLFSAVAAFGLDNILIREIARDEPSPGAHGQVVRVTSSLKVVLALFAIALSIDGAVLVQLPRATVIDIALFSPYILLVTFSSNGLFGDVLQAFRQNGAVANASLVSAFVTLAATVVAAYLRLGVEAFLGAYLLAGIVDIGICYLRARRQVQTGFGWDARTAWYLVRESFPLAVATVFVLIYVRIDTVLLEKLTNSSQVALYGVAYKFFDVFSTVWATVMLVLFPMLARAYDASPTRFKTLYARLVPLSLAFSLPAGLAVVVLRQPLIRLIVGGQFSAAELAVPGLMVAAIAILPASVSSYVMVITHRQRWSLLLALLASALNIGLNLYFIPRGGYVAAAWTTAATEGFVIVYNVAVVALTARLSPFGRPLLAVVAASAAFVVLLIPGVPPYPAGAGALVLYMALLALFGVARPRFLVETFRPRSSPVAPSVVGAEPYGVRMPAADDAGAHSGSMPALRTMSGVPQIERRELGVQQSVARPVAHSPAGSGSEPGIQPMPESLRAPTQRGDQS